MSGADYCLYKGGDPSNSHSIASVRVCGHSTRISARELIAYTRVQNHVAKNAMFVYSRQNTEVSEEPCRRRGRYNDHTRDDIETVIFNFLDTSDRA
jgi:hypothetical protein